MADSPGLLFIFDENCNGQDMRRTVQKFKRKLIHVSLKSRAELEGTTAARVKRKRVCKNHGEETVHETLESKSEDRRCDTVALRDHISETEIEKKWNGKRKLNSRLSRILKGKLSKVTIHRDSIDSCDTDSKLSTDSGIEFESYVGTQNVDTPVTSRKESDIVAMDCEFVGVGPQRKNALGRVSIMDYDGNLLCDIYAKPEDAITDYRTPWSGIRKRNMVHAVPFDTAQNTVKRILQGKIVVGHSIHNDLWVLQINHPKSSIRDTAKCKIIRSLAGLETSKGNGLKRLAQVLLGRKIQLGEHCSVEDAKAALDLYKLVEDEWEGELVDKEWQQPQKTKIYNSVQDNYLNDEFWPDEVSNQHFQR